MLRDVGPDVDLVAATVTRDGSALSAEGAEALESTSLRVLDIDLPDAVITGDSIWWMATRSGISLPDDTQALHEAVARFDIATGLITTWAPTAGIGARFLPEDSAFNVATLDDAQLAVRADTLFVADTTVREEAKNGRLLRFDEASGTLEVFHEPDPAGADYWTLDLLDTTAATNTDVWTIVTRYTITEENPDGSRSSTFERTVVQLDPVTGAEITATPLA